MSHCPNCKNRLTIFNWRPNCPHCNVNLTFFNFEERFLNDAKNTELGFAKVRVSVAKLKNAYIGTRLAIARIIACLLPILALLVPFSSQVFHLPLVDEKYNIGVLGLVSLVQNEALPFLLDLIKSEIIGDVFMAMFVSLIAFVVTAAFAVLALLMTLLCFFSVKKFAMATVVFSGFGLVSTIVTMVLSNRFIGIAAARMPEIISTSQGLGGYVMLLAFTISIILNYIFYKKDFDLKIDGGDLYRVEVAKKLKRGEVKLEDLPFPIYETEEERAKRLEEEAEEEAIEAEKEAKKEAEKTLEKEKVEEFALEGGQV